MFSYPGRFAMVTEYLSDKYSSNVLLDRIKADEVLKQEMLKTSDARADQTNLEMLMEKGAKWGDLAAMLAKEGADKVKSELLAYGLTRGAATALVALLDRMVPQIGVECFLSSYLPLTVAVCGSVGAHCVHKWWFAAIGARSLRVRQSGTRQLQSVASPHFARRRQQDCLDSDSRTAVQRQEHARLSRSTATSGLVRNV